MISRDNKSFRELKYLVIKGLREEFNFIYDPDKRFESVEYDIILFIKLCDEGDRLFGNKCVRKFNIEKVVDDYIVKWSLDELIGIIKTTDDRDNFDVFLDMYNDYKFETA
jgi:hypothetical protein